MNEIDQLYLELLASWGDHPIDEEEVKNQLTKYGQAEYDRGWNDRQQCQEMTGDYDITGLRIKES